MMTITCVAYNLIRLNPAVSKSDGYSGLHWIKCAVSGKHLSMQVIKCINYLTCKPQLNCSYSFK